MPDATAWAAAGSSLGGGPAPLARGELITLDPLPGIEFQQRALQDSVRVRTARIDAEGAADLHRAPGLMDMAVQGQHRLMALDRRPDGPRPDRLHEQPAALDDRLQRAVKHRSLVDGGPERRHVEVEHRAAGIGDV